LSCRKPAQRGPISGGAIQHRFLRIADHAGAQVCGLKPVCSFILLATCISQQPLGSSALQLSQPRPLQDENQSGGQEYPRVGHEDFELMGYDLIRRSRHPSRFKGIRGLATRHTGRIMAFIVRPMKAFPLLCALLLTAMTRAHAAQRPNILWLVAEDFGPALSCYGRPDVFTPNLDGLARLGVRYTRFYHCSGLFADARRL
jgi:hypothetical protein